MYSCDLIDGLILLSIFRKESGSMTLKLNPDKDSVEATYSWEPVSPYSFNVQVHPNVYVRLLCVRFICLVPLVRLFELSFSFLVDRLRQGVVVNILHGKQVPSYLFQLAQDAEILCRTGYTQLPLEKLPLFIRKNFI